MALTDPYTISAATLSVPASTNATGTFTAGAGNKILTGSGTSFNSELQSGGWLVDLTNEEVRQIEFVNSDTEVQLYTGFASAQAATTLGYISRSKSKVQFMEITPAASIDISGNTWGTTVYTDGQINTKGIGRAFCRPVVVNADATTALVKLTMFSNRQ
tara:strand:+ start:977 stop:1453 length:477 start_codon:yes stop_codon:yes gene_type:complete